METTSETLLRDGLRDAGKIETTLREMGNACCRNVVEALLSMPGLRIPGDERREGERMVGGVARTVRMLFGEVHVERNWYKAPNGKGRFPLDEALGLVDGYTPALASLVCMDAAREPFEAAAASFLPHTGVQVGGREFQRLAGRLGCEFEAFLRADLGPGQARPQRVYVEADGTGAPIRHKELEGRKGKGEDGKAHTHEVKIGALFTEHPRPGQPPWRDLDSTTYVATDERCGPFGAMLRAEFDRRFAGCPETVALGDGAPWVWELFRIHFSWAVQIVDFHHAAEHVADLAELVHPRGSADWKALRRNWTGKLYDGKFDAFLRSARAAFPEARKEAGEKELAYFETNRERMRYSFFREKGYFIGSGVVEAAAKTLVGQRFKQSGMHWSLHGLANLLPIRTALCSNRFEEFWTWRSNKRTPAA